MDGQSSGPILKVLSSAGNLRLQHIAKAWCGSNADAIRTSVCTCAFVAAGCGALGRWSQPHRGAA